MHKVAHITAGHIQLLPALCYCEHLICTVDYLHGCWHELVFLVNPEYTLSHCLAVIDIMPPLEATEDITVAKNVIKCLN